MLLEGPWCALAAPYSARGCWPFSAPVYPSGPLQYRYSTLHISVSREAHAFRAAIIIERDCWQSGMGIQGIQGI